MIGGYYLSGGSGTYDRTNEVFTQELIKEYRLLKNVSKEDIMNLAKKINLDTVFWLEGDL